MNIVKQMFSQLCHNKLHKNVKKLHNLTISDMTHEDTPTFIQTSKSAYSVPQHSKIVACDKELSVELN